MQFMDDAIWSLLQQGIVSPHEAFMKSIEKNRFKGFLPDNEQSLANSAGAAPDDKNRARAELAKRKALLPRR
jgi:twitching motility protein PilT